MNMQKQEECALESKMDESLLHEHLKSDEQEIDKKLELAGFLVTTGVRAGNEDGRIPY
jgi:hypothetical protein